MTSLWRNPETDPPPADTRVLGFWAGSHDYAIVERDTDGRWTDEFGAADCPDYWQPLPPPPVPRD